MNYSKKVMDHFAHPRNVGDMPEANAVGQVGNQKCGDIMKMMLKIENDVIVDAKFQTFGCGAAVATSSMCRRFRRAASPRPTMEATFSVPARRPFS